MPVVYTCIFFNFLGYTTFILEVVKLNIVFCVLYGVICMSFTYFFLYCFYCTSSSVTLAK